MKKIDIKTILKEIKTSDFVLACKIPLGYLQGLPILQIKNDRLCVTIPYLKYKVTGVVDKTLVFPIRYTITLSLPDKNVIGFSDLSFEPIFKNINYSKAIGYFRHDEIKHLNKDEFKAKKDELFAEYDKVINALLYGEEYSEENEEKMCKLMKMIIEPSLLPIYKALDEDFYNKYLS